MTVPDPIRLTLPGAVGEGRLAQLLAGATQVRVAVVGDFVLDRYLVIEPRLRETSLETGRSAHQVVTNRVSPGHGGTVTNNLRSLGVTKVFAVGAVGQDGEGYELRSALARQGVDVSHLFVSASTVTGAYLKPVRLAPGGRERELDRFDIRRRAPLDPVLERKVIRRLRSLTDPTRDQVDAVIVADQVEERNHGIITDAVRSELRDLAASRPNLVWLADSRRRIGEFRYLMLKPNRTECLRSASTVAHGSEGGMADAQVLRERAWRLAAAAERPVFVTCGSEGMLVVQPDQGIVQLPAVAGPGRVDPTGAGDATSAGLVVALVQGAIPTEAGAFGSLAAGVTVRQVGTTGTATPGQVADVYAELRRGGTSHPLR